MPRPIIISMFLAVAMIAGTLLTAPVHTGSPEAFYGQYQGTGTSRDPNVTFFELTQRDLGVRIGPDGAGFSSNGQRSSATPSITT